MAEHSDHDTRVRTVLDQVLPTVSQSLIDKCAGIEHTGKTLRELLGPGSEAILPGDNRIMPPQRLAAALLLWARKRLCRSQTRKSLVKMAVNVTKLTRRLQQKMASRPPPTFVSSAAQRFIVYKGSTRLRYRLRSVLWAPGPVEDRLFDRVFKSTDYDLANHLGKSVDEPPPKITPLVAEILKARKKRKPPIAPDSLPIALPPAPPLIKALRGGTRNSAEGCTGVHARESSVRSLALIKDLRVKLREVVLAMGSSKDGNAGPAEEEPLGTCDKWNGIRWRKCTEVGEPLQEAWALAVAERLYSMWTNIGLAADGSVKPFPTEEARARQGVPGLPGCWCPARPRAPSRAPVRIKMRTFLGLLTEQKRIHMNELIIGYAHVTKTPMVGEGEDSLLKKHAQWVLKALKYEKRANARWEILLHWQLAPEPAPGEQCDPAAVAAELRGAQGKLEALEKLLIEGLSEYSDARGALRMHMFDKDADIPLKTQLANRLAGTAFGELLGQRFEMLESPELAPQFLGAAALFQAEGGGEGSDAAAAPSAASASTVYVVPAAEAAEELAVDNVELAGFIGCLPAMLRNATGKSGPAVVGDPAAYDLFLSGKLKSLMENPTTQHMLTIGSACRFAWAAYRKGGAAPPKEPPADPSAPKPRPPQLGPKQLANINKLLQPVIGRIRGATPKGAKPDEQPTITALKEELGALEADATTLKNPTDADIEEIRACMNAVLDLVAAAVYAMRTKGVGVWAEPPPAKGEEVAPALEDTAAAADPEAAAAAAEAAVAEVVAKETRLKARNQKSIRKLRDFIGEALSQSLDTFLVSGLDAPTIISVVGEAVGDVSVEQSDLIRSLYKLLYKRTLDAVITSPKIPNQAPRKFCVKLVKRKPCVVVSADEAAAWCLGAGFVRGADLKGEAAKAKTWAKAVVTALDGSRAAQASLLRWVTYVTLDELRDIQRCLSAPPPGGSAILLSEMVSTGVGGVARQTLLNKLDLAMVPDSDDPLRLNRAFRLLAGREPQGGASEAAYGLPLRFSEGEERTAPQRMEDLQDTVSELSAVQKNWDSVSSLRSPCGPAVAALGLLDAGQRLRPDGSQFNVVRLHRIWCMQNSAADKASCLTMERMLDEFVTLTIRSAFFDKISATADDVGDEFVLRGKSDVFRFLINDGFAALKAKGVDGKKKVEGCQFVQPAMLTADGETRVIFGAGTRDTCGSLAERFRMGEQIVWGPWGNILSILRVEKPLDTHYEFSTFFSIANYAAVRKALDANVVYYCVLHHFAPESKQSPRFVCRKFCGAKEVFARLDNEMSRQSGNISVVSPPLSGEKLRDLRARRMLTADMTDAEVCNNDARVPADQAALAREAHQQCLYYGEPAAALAGRLGGGGAEGPKRSIIHYGGKWLPLGEGANRKGDLIICVRETIGWKYTSKPTKPKPGEEPGEGPPSAARGVGMLCREFFIDTMMRQPQPHAPSFAAQWRLEEARRGK